jgi:upstream activation factor subunit UAF30
MAPTKKSGKKAAVRKPAAKKAAPKKAARKAPAKKAAAKKSPARKSAAKKAPARKTAAKKSPAKKTAAKKTAKKAAPKKATAKKAAPKKAAPKKAAKKAAKKSGAKRAPNPAFMKAMQPDAELAAVVGDQPQPRTEVTKKIWAYIKKNNLQDANERRMIVADDKLKKVFGGKSRVSMFEMTKHVNNHLK